MRESGTEVASLVKLLLNAAFNTKVSVGITRYLNQLVPALSQLCDLTVLTPDPEIFGDNCRTIRIPGFVRRYVHQVLWSATALRARCSGAYDVLLSTTPVLPIATNLPAMAVVHDLTPLLTPRLHNAKVKAAFWLGLQTLRWADAVLCDSNNTRRDLVRLHLVSPERIHRVPPGAGLTPVDPKSILTQQLHPFVLYVGGHPPHKNVSRLVAAFAQLKPANDLKLVLVGSGDPKHVAVSGDAARKHAVEDRVVFLHDVADERLSNLYRECSLFVYPSTYEGFGLPVLEALAHGAPVACSHSSSLPEVAGEAAVYFNPFSVRDIAAKMQMLLDNTALAVSLGRLGPIRAQRFSWNRAAREIYEIATGLAGRSILGKLPAPRL